MSKEITIRSNTALKQYSIDKPADMVKMASVLKGHIVKHKLYTEIVGKNYVQVEGWQFAGFLLGIYPKVGEVKNLSTDTEMKWQAEVILYRGEEEIGRGIAICSNKENKKESFDEYAILSMAQTRAIGKAYRNMVGWVMKLAGYEATPSEEMKKMGDTVYEPSPLPTINVGASKGQKQGATATVPRCKECTKPVTEAEAQFSQTVYKKILCREHQPKKK